MGLGWADWICRGLGLGGREGAGAGGLGESGKGVVVYCAWEDEWGCGNGGKSGEGGRGWIRIVG